MQMKMQEQQRNLDEQLKMEKEDKVMLQSMLEELANNLSAAAHLIHGTSDGRFKITYCPGPDMSQEEIESVGFGFGKYDEIVEKYQFDSLKDGWNTVNGEEIFYISNPALGLWQADLNSQ